MNPAGENEQTVLHFGERQHPQWFSNTGVHWDHTEGVLEHRLLDSTHQNFHLVGLV